MKLFLAGADDSRWIECMMSARHPYMLCTYWILKDGVKERWLQLHNKSVRNGATWIIDSGLFTMMFGSDSNREFTEQGLMEYAEGYLNTLRGFKYNQTCVEMDVHKILGLDALGRFRKYMESNWDIDKTIYVWHLEEKPEGLQALAKRYPYIAISVPELINAYGNKKGNIATREALKIALDANPNVKVHLLGTNSVGLLSCEGYYSCDATSWQGGMRWANYELFNGKKLVKCSSASKGFQQATSQAFKKLRKYQRDHTTIYYAHGAVGCRQYHKVNAYINRKYFNGEKVPEPNY